MRNLVGIISAIAITLACSGAPGGPAQLGRMSDNVDQTASPLQSNDILRRSPRTSAAKVKHILIAWRGLAGRYPGKMDARAQARSRKEADLLVEQLFAQLKNGAPVATLMTQYSEDPASAKTGRTYEVTPDAPLAPEFKDLGLRLEVGEVGKVLTDFGWHIMVRVE